MNVFTPRNTALATAMSVALLSGINTASANDGAGYDSADSRLVIYFTRHAEKQTVTKATGNAAQIYTSVLDQNGDAVFTGTESAGQAIGSNLDEVCGESKCAEELSPQGENRAMLLADWFAARGITEKMDAVYATHKTRTQQTVTPTATVAGLPVIALDPYQNFGFQGPVIEVPYLQVIDGPYEVNPFGGASELSPESTTGSECATLQAIDASRAAGHDTILIAGHSGTLYDIMGNGVEDCYDAYERPLTGLNLDTGNTVAGTGNLDRFPKDGKGKVANFGDLWKVVIRRNGQVDFKWRKALNQPEVLRVNETVN